MKNEVSVKIIDFGSDDYRQALALRELVLRKPLGLQLNDKDTEKDREQINIVAFDGDKVIGTTLLQLKGNKYKMRQVAVLPEYQNKKIGQTLLDFCQNWAKRVHINEIFCDARVCSQGFYEKNGFKAIGEPFTQTTIPHIYMWKHIC